MIEPEWKRICGIFSQPDGIVSAVWIAKNPETDVCHLYDAVVFGTKERREVVSVIADGLAARGRWIPVAWPPDAKELAEELLNRGIRTLVEPAKDSAIANEMTAIVIQERMRTGRFKVDKRLGTWLDELKSYHRKDEKMPREGYPFMAATQCAMSQLDWARRQGAGRKKMQNFPRVAIV